ncbi:MAG: patatin-like phospholipase family protein [Candidatus Theseobacter exili]|nr:patatin-like phospholipase family protein [Candidatus Theseobacter exili]
MKKVGLVIGGGGSKTIAFLGIAEVLQENNIPFHHLVTSSMGSLLGILLANHVSAKDIKHAFMEKCRYRDWLRPSISKLGLFSQSRVRRILNELLPISKLEESEIPITIVGSNLNRVTEHLFTDGDAVTAVCASCAYPMLYKPVIIDGREMIADGGILNNVPADICRNIVGSDGFVITMTASSPFDTSLESLNKRRELVHRIIYGPLEIQRERITEQYSDIVIRPFENHSFCYRTWKKLFNFFDVKQLEEYYEIGKEKGKEAAKEILEMLKTNSDSTEANS